VAAQDEKKDASSNTSKQRDEKRNLAQRKGDADLKDIIYGDVWK